MPKLLVIDDDRRVRDTIKLVLEAVGYTLAFATNGREGLARFAEFKPDLVITDILMPEKEGIATITELRALNKTIPIIALSGGGRVGNMDFLKVAQKMGATKTMSKPFDPDELVDTITALLPKAA